MAVSPDGQFLAAGGGPDARPHMRVWNLRTRAARPWPAGAVVSGLAYSPDGGRVVVTGYGASPAVHDATTGARLFALQGHGASATAVAYSPDGARVATAGEHKTIRVWLAKDGQEILTLKGHTDIARSVAFTKDGRKLVTGGWDRTIRVRDATPTPGD